MFLWIQGRNVSLVRIQLGSPSKITFFILCAAGPAASGRLDREPAPVKNKLLAMRFGGGGERR
jgi:hypothetical protein